MQRRYQYAKVLKLKVSSKMQLKEYKMSSLKILHNKIWLMLTGLANLSPSDFVIHKASAE